MDQRDKNPLRAQSSGQNGQGGIHGGGASHGYDSGRCQNACGQGHKQQGQRFAQDIADKGHCTEFTAYGL